MKRKSGILMHITSLPSDYGIGSLGKTAYDFVDFLERAGQKVWQILPINYTLESENFSPYKSTSPFSSNYDLIDLEILKSEGFIDEIDIPFQEFDDRYVNYPEVRKNKNRILKEAFKRYDLIPKDEIKKFLSVNSYWINDYVTFMALYEKNNFEDFDKWKIFERSEYTEKFYIFLEYIFHKQWKNLKKYANSKGVEIFGDIPIYISENSSDFYFKRNLFLVDENKNPKMIAGVPPDNFSEDGQVWGNPLYNWDEMKKDDYKWWFERIKHSFIFFDIVRIDHFRAFDKYYAIDKKTMDAKHGKWFDGPGKIFFDKLKDKFGNLKIVVEDLGIITESTKKLVEYTGYPNMKILQFAFDNDATNEHLPHNYKNNCVCYTGTHDNKTVKQWLETEPNYKIDYAKKYLKLDSYNIYSQGFIDAALSSVSFISIIPIQDWMDYGSFARLNEPGNVNGAWKFRLKKFEFNDWLADIIKEKTKFYGR